MNGTRHFVGKWEYVTKLRPHVTHKLEIRRNVSTVLFLTCDDWDLKLPYVLFAYRTAEHSTTKKEPLFLVYGRKARLSVELQLPTTSSTQDDLNNQENLNKRVNMFLKLTERRHYAAENIKKEQKKKNRKCIMILKSNHLSLKWKIGGQNNANDETFLPPKKRKNSEGIVDEYETNDVRILRVEAETMIVNYPPSENWQKKKSRFFGLKINNCHKTVSIRQASINARPAKHAQMRGDGTEDAVKEFDPNVFNLLSDHENFVDLLF
ncbi:hypothetical protein CHS0354_029089 [Potamilus streckersoni]|uniref:Uncharacterized protein n=1 Tax=Potamilus streckersoni TaxID=2493646 RepID=A0AAE0SWY4_9BIVA|nr:hypothetical protein CHS0354_029089 [Potamilus streckersoni]